MTIEKNTTDEWIVPDITKHLWRGCRYLNGKYNGTLIGQWPGGDTFIVGRGPSGICHTSDVQVRNEDYVKPKPEKKYRTPSMGDYSKRIEVRNSLDGIWIHDFLLGFRPKAQRPWIGTAFDWVYARIEVNSVVGGEGEE